MSAVHAEPWREPDDARRWPAAAALALVVEAALIGGVLWYARHAPEPPPPPPMQIVLEAPRPAPKTVAPPAPKPIPKPIPKPMPKPQPKPLPKPVMHHVAPRPVVPPPLPTPKVVAPPAPVPDTHPAMPVAAPAPPAPAPPPAPPAVDLASIKADFEAQLRSAIQTAVHYPTAARLMHLTGKTLVAFTYRDGQISGVRVVTSGGSDLLDNAAMDAVRRAPYPATPTPLQGRSMTFDIWVRFHLNDS